MVGQVAETYYKITIFELFKSSTVQKVHKMATVTIQIK
jgi:hypothetical protein